MNDKERLDEIFNSTDYPAVKQNNKMTTGKKMFVGLACFILFFLCIGVFSEISGNDKSKKEEASSYSDDDYSDHDLDYDSDDDTDYDSDDDTDYDSDDDTDYLEEIKSEIKKITKKKKKKANKATYKNKCKTYGYREILRNPDKYDGKKIKVSGTVLQADEFSLFGISTVTLRVEDSNGNDWYIDYEYSDGENKVIEDDKVTIYGKSTGSESYTTVLGSSRTIPSIDAKYIDIK